MSSANLKAARGYFTIAALTLALGLSAQALNPWLAIGLIMVCLVHASAGIVELWDKRRKQRREEEYHNARMNVITPVIEQERVSAEYLRELREFNKQVQRMTPEQLKVASLLAPGYIDYVGAVDDQEKRYYTEREARLVIYYWTEEKHGYVYLPTQHDKGRGSRVQMVIKRVTDDLLVKGLAQRTHRNDRAFLVVDRDEAYVGLMEEK